MSYFPFFREISGCRVLVAGGGEVALRRAKIFAEFGADVTCIAPEFCEGFSVFPSSLIHLAVQVDFVHLLHDYSFPQDPI